MKTLKLTLTLLAIMLFNSCGKSSVNSFPTNPGTNPTTTNTGNTNIDSWNSLDAIEEALESQSMSPSASTSYLYAYDEEEGSDMRYDYSTIDTDTVDVDTYEVGDDEIYDSFILRRSDIIDNIFNRDSEYGRSRTIDQYPCNGAFLYSNNGQGRQLRAIQLVHTLESGESLIHVISPDVPAYANPLATAVSSSSELWIFTSQSFETKRIVKQIGNQFLNIQCQ